MKFDVVFLLIFCLASRGLFGQGSEKRNPAPVFTTKEKTRVSIDSSYFYQFVAMDSADEALTYSVPVLPSWLSYSTSNQTLTGKPSHAGQYPVSIQVSDGKSIVEQRFMLTVLDKRTVNILALGNSITNGTDRYNSYRRMLWLMLHEANYNIDFVGSWSKHHMGGIVPNPDFDMDHEGHSGWTFDHIFRPPDWDVLRGNIHQWLQQYTPDIVLVELGTNDVFQCRKIEDVIRNLSELVTVLRTENSRVKICIATVLPLGAQWSNQKLCGDDQPYFQKIDLLNASIRSFVQGQSTKLSPLILVDQFAGIDPVKHMYDDIHPNAEGEQLVAKKWYEAIKGFLRVTR